MFSDVITVEEYIDNASHAICMISNMLHWDRTGEILMQPRQYTVVSVEVNIAAIKR